MVVQRLRCVVFVTNAKIFPKVRRDRTKFVIMYGCFCKSKKDYFCKDCYCNWNQTLLNLNFRHTKTNDEDSSPHFTADKNSSSSYFVVVVKLAIAMTRNIIIIIVLSQHSLDYMYGLYWLLVKHIIVHKVILTTFKALHGMSPRYISDLITLKSTTIAL